MQSRPFSPPVTTIAPSFTFQSALLCAFQPNSVWPSNRLIQPSASSASVSGLKGSVILALAGSVRRGLCTHACDGAAATVTVFTARDRTALAADGGQHQNGGD